MTATKGGVSKRRKEKLTDADRHKRFVATAKEVGASNDPNDFDKAFETVVARNVLKK